MNQFANYSIGNTPSPAQFQDPRLAGLTVQQNGEPEGPRSRATGVPLTSIAGLSPQMILAYVRSQMDELDTQIADLMSELNGRRTRIAELNQQQRDLREERARVENEEDDNYGNQRVDSRNRMNNRIEALPDVEVGNAADGGFTLAEIDAMIESLDAKIGEINDASEFDMLRLNSLMSKRQQAFEIGSQMLSTLNQTAMTAIRNTAG